MRHLLAALFVAFAALTAHAQWDLEDSHTTASLRGIHSVGGGVAWASGTNGTVLRTEDGGYLWQGCATPPAAEKLDFRGIQAFDENTAIVMSSGKGELSRIYKTVDGCKTWKLVFTNPDKDGFFDSIRAVTRKQIYLLGDPVDGKFAMFYSQDSGDTWFVTDDPGLNTPQGGAAFAASNSALAFIGPFLFFGTGGPTASVFYTYPKCADGKTEVSCPIAWASADTHLAATLPSAGVFSVAGRSFTSMSGKLSITLVAVGGDYAKPEASTGTAASSTDSGKTWTPAATSPAGYRSAVAYDSGHFIAVGPNGSDYSTDNGKTWHRLGTYPKTAANWNALSLPFAVGPNGRIAKLRADAIKP